MPPTTGGLAATGKICTPGTAYRPIATADARPPTPPERAEATRREQSTSLAEKLTVIDTT
ncbi:hypothetical protein B4U45_27795 [Mycobacterium persicum]|uniref:Uncharacterized protein n=1 Tax=Mycobacterium persicum TaxID=1487726 RepID=A0A8E2IXI5_9MYCO|nr:hypothetical protein B1T49_27535 [Mycobacterium persicum]ORC04430.1 hypothetical protein B1T48_27510 [Mycobacterium persicum]ORC09836.1 hypothetical protein B4U45_27795 [Mycobacterium persicum]